MGEHRVRVDGGTQAPEPATPTEPPEEIGPEPATPTEPPEEVGPGPAYRHELTPVRSAGSGLVFAPRVDDDDGPYHGRRRMPEPLRGRLLGGVLVVAAVGLGTALALQPPWVGGRTGSAQPPGSAQWPDGAQLPGDAGAPDGAVPGVPARGL